LLGNILIHNTDSSGGRATDTRGGPEGPGPQICRQEPRMLSLLPVKYSPNAEHYCPSANTELYWLAAEAHSCEPIAHAKSVISVGESQTRDLHSSIQSLHRVSVTHSLALCFIQGRLCQTARHHACGPHTIQAGWNNTPKAQVQSVSGMYKVVQKDEPLQKYQRIILNRH